ncbi:YqgE/AlgH family protein [Alphaproteobacteria bacterium endosymbiont of Tiliacea citrago]|uniref:YqgE/AlgH family protein n=1 Tax=Alphaproteobacteria bacterium endosymbiont of Tiliacea citrago TaxID=3077944 RepID=UPI00313AA9B0
MNENLKNDMQFLQGNFIIATPLLLDPFFEKSIIFMTESKVERSYGFLVTHSLNNDELFEEIHSQIIGSPIENAEIFLGGPVDPKHFFVLHSNDVSCKKTLCVSENVCITNLSDAVEFFYATPSFYRIFAGYCDWKMNQLESEIKEGVWLIKKFSNNLLFTNSKKKWENLIKSFDIDLKKFSLNSGVA